MRHEDGVAGSETKLQLASRAYSAMDRVTASGVEQSIVVTHGGLATFLIACWIGMPIEAAGLVKFRTTPGSISVLRQDATSHHREVAVLDDVRHLG